MMIQMKIKYNIIALHNKHQNYKNKNLLLKKNKNKINIKNI